MRGRVRRVSEWVLPSAARRFVRRRRVTLRHGVTLGPDFDYYIDDATTFERKTRLGGPCYVANSSIGAYTYIETGCRISRSTIGRFCSIAPYAVIGMPEHPVDGFVSTHPAFYRHAPNLGWDLTKSDLRDELDDTHVGNDVWVGVGASIRSGVTIGDGAVIGAGAVVVRDVEPYEIVGGVPARRIRLRFDERTIEALLRDPWWEWPEDQLRAHVELMSDVDRFIGRCD